MCLLAVGWLGGLQVVTEIVHSLVQCAYHVAGNHVQQGLYSGTQFVPVHPTSVDNCSTSCRKIFLDSSTRFVCAMETDTRPNGRAANLEYSLPSSC